MRFNLKAILLYSIFASLSLVDGTYPHIVNSQSLIINEVDSLIQQLKSNDSQIRTAATHKLISLGPIAIPSLNKALLNDDEKIACSCASILGEMGMPGLEGLIAFFKDKSYEYLDLPRHKSALDSLYRIGPSAIPKIIEMCILDDDYHPKTSSFFEDLIIKRFKKTSTPYLIEVTGSNKPKLQHLALIILRQLNDERSIPIAINLLNNKNRAIQIEAAWTLGLLGQNAQSSLPYLLQILKSSDNKVLELDIPFKYFAYSSLKENIIEVITRIDNDRTLTSDIIPFMQSDNPSIRLLSITYLENAKIDKKELSNLFISKIDDPNAKVRAECAKTLGNIGLETEQIIQSLKKALLDPFGIVRKEALESLLKITKSESIRYELIIKYLNDDDPIVQISAISNMHNYDLKPSSFALELVDKTRSYIDEVKIVTLNEIGRIDKPSESLVDCVIECLDSKNTEVKSSAINAITNIGPLAVKAIIPLKNIIIDNHYLSLRVSSFGALQKIGFKSKDTLIDLLNNPNSDIRELSTRTIGDVQPVIHSATPYLLKLFQADKEIKVRQAAAISLGKIGAGAVENEILSYVCDALDSNDYTLLVSALDATRSIGPTAYCSIPKLISLFNHKDISIREKAISIIGIFGVDASSAIPELLAIINKKETSYLGVAIQALGQINNPTPQTISTLISVLENDPNNLYDVTIRTLGQFGTKSAPAIDNVIKILNGPNRNYIGQCVDTLVSITIDARDKDATELIDKIILIENTFKEHPDYSSRKYEKGKALKEIIHARKFLESSNKETISDMISRWHQILPWYVIIIVYLLILYILWVLVLLLIFLIAPKKIPVIHNFFTELKIKKINFFNIEFNIEMPPEKILLLDIALGSKRVLNSWIKIHLSNAKNIFLNKQTVKQRENHIDIPISLNGRLYDKLTPKDIKANFQSDISCLLIHGDGGTGKTHLACQIAKMCFNEDVEFNFLDHAAIPILIEEEIQNLGDPKTSLISTISAQLRLITGSIKNIPHALILKLLEQKRVIVIIDHLSEMESYTASAVNTIFQDTIINAFIVTSRIEEKLGGISKIVLEPLKLKKGYLFHFFDAYFRKFGHVEVFNDQELGTLLSKLSILVGDREITLLLCKLYAEQLLAYKRGDMGDLPKNTPELMLQYLNELNRNVQEHKMPDKDVHSLAKSIAWLSIEKNITPSDIPYDLIKQKLGDIDFDKFMNYLIDKIRILKVKGAGKNKFRFILDPIAEYLASMHIIETFNEDDWNTFFERLNQNSGDLEKGTGFINSLIDCCNANLQMNELPKDIIANLYTRISHEDNHN